MGSTCPGYNAKTFFFSSEIEAPQHYYYYYYLLVCYASLGNSPYYDLLRSTLEEKEFLKGIFAQSIYNINAVSIYQSNSVK